MAEDKQARWKGAGMGEYYCSLCCEVGNVREQRCPNCHALMYTQLSCSNVYTERI